MLNAVPHYLHSTQKCKKLGDTLPFTKHDAEALMTEHGTFVESFGGIRRTSAIKFMLKFNVKTKILTFSKLEHHLLGNVKP